MAQFTGHVMSADRIGPSLRVHSGPGVGEPVTGSEAPGTALTFDAWTLGSAHLDPVANTWDDRWFRIAGTNSWVASAFIDGEPKTSVPDLQAPPFRTALHAVLNVANIPSTDGNPALAGQCVSLVKVYAQHLGAAMGPTGGDGGARFGFINYNQLGLSLGSTQAQRITFTGNEQPRAGDIMFFDQVPGNTAGHVGVVQYVNGAGPVILEQSNWNDGAPTNTVVDCLNVDLHGQPPHPQLGVIMGWLRLHAVG